jgi:CMP-N-acetylneuraminic acid synthetase
MRDSEYQLVYGFIFARGGSKGLPGKNIKVLNGKPLINYAIECAQQCPDITKVFISTDDIEISRAASSFNVEIIDRPSELAADNSPEWLSWQHAVRQVEKKYGAFDVFVSLPTTSPLRQVRDVTSAIRKLESTKADTCISVTKSGRSPWFNMVTVSGDEVLLLSNNGPAVERRQDAPPTYDITTVVYATTPSFILKNKGIFSGKVTSIEVPKDRAVDIDDIYDFEFAEMMLRRISKYDAN